LAIAWNKMEIQLVIRLKKKKAFGERLRGNGIQLGE
jgi:hypothetical protein